MQSVKPLLLLLLTCSLLSCNPVTTRMGDEKTSDCGEVPVGVTIDKRELDLAGATLAGFSLGKFEVKDTPQFQKIISEAASNSAATDVLVCKAIARAGARGNPEMVDYFTRMTHFFARQPSISEQLQWRQTSPFPRAAAHETARSGRIPVESRPEEVVLLAKTCRQPIIGLKRRPEVFLPAWLSVVNRLHKERFPSEHDLLNLYNLKIRMRDEPNDPKDLFQEALYTLKCLEDVGELRLEKLGTTRRYWGEDFENQRIVFKNP